MTTADDSSDSWIAALSQSRIPSDNHQYIQRLMSTVGIREYRAVPKSDKSYVVAVREDALPDHPPRFRREDLGERCRSYRSVTGIGGVDIAVEIHGLQYTDGRIECRIALAGALEDLDSAADREVATALIAATDLIESR